jgi:DNA-nicking Smr family endonuclease
MTSATPPKERLRSLDDLQQVKQKLQDQARAHEAQQLREAVQQRRHASGRDLFLRAAGPVQVLPATGRAALQPAPPPPIPVQHLRDEQAVLKESLSDEFDITTLLEIDDQLSFRRPGIGTEVAAKLRRGHWSIQAQLDLHGLRSDAARESLGAFLREAGQAGLRCVRVVHGKGHGSPGKTPVLKNKVHAWLVQKEAVLAFVQARPADGGAGAVVVLLKPARG